MSEIQKQRLTYVNLQANTTIRCFICIDVVSPEAVKISCHDDLLCSECVAHWIGSQMIAQKLTTCPKCRAPIDASNLRAATVTNNYDAEHDFLYNSDEEEDFDEGDYDDDVSDFRSDLRDDQETMSEVGLQNDEDEDEMLVEPVDLNDGDSQGELCHGFETGPIHDDQVTDGHCVTTIERPAAHAGMIYEAQARFELEGYEEGMEEEL